MEDEAMEFARQIGDAIRGLQAGQIAQTRMLRALISTHPNPDALREAWTGFAAGPSAAAATSKVIDPGRAAMHEALARALDDWTRRLEEDLPKRGPRQD